MLVLSVQNISLVSPLSEALFANTFSHSVVAFSVSLMAKQTNLQIHTRKGKGLSWRPREEGEG